MSYIGIFCIFVSFFFVGISHVISTSRFTSLIPVRFSLLTVVIFSSLYVPITQFYSHYDQVDKHNDYSASRYSKEVFDGLEPDAVIVTWWNYYTPFWYRQAVLGERPDIRIENNSYWAETVARYYGNRPIYLVESRDEISSEYELVPEHSMYKVVGRRVKP